MSSAIFFPIGQLRTGPQELDAKFAEIDTVEFVWWFQGLVYVVFSFATNLFAMGEAQKMSGRTGGGGSAPSGIPGLPPYIPGMASRLSDLALFTGPSFILTFFSLAEMYNHVDWNIPGRKVWAKVVTASWITSGVFSVMGDLIPTWGYGRINDYGNVAALALETLRVNLQMGYRLVGFTDF